MKANPTSLAPVYIHSSAQPDATRAALLAALRAGHVLPRFHYEGLRQSRKWLELYRRWAPFANDPGCRQMYHEAFLAAPRDIPAGPLDVVGLGCGGGQKERALIEFLQKDRRTVRFLACDSSVPLVLGAAAVCAPLVGSAQTRLLVCDLGRTDDLGECLAGLLGRLRPRILTFFGMIPNFEPRAILRRLGSGLRRQDRLLFSANLAPGSHYLRGLRQVLPQYDNRETRSWLHLFLRDAGLNPRHGRLAFEISRPAPGQPWRRIEAVFGFSRETRVHLFEETVAFAKGDRLRVFFSYRYSVPMLGGLLAENGLEIQRQWLAPNGEEAVFLVRKG